MCSGFFHYIPSDQQNLSKNEIWNDDGWLRSTVEPVWNDTLWKDCPVWKDHFPICENVYLPLDSVKSEPVWNDHLDGKTTFSWHLGWSFQTDFTVHVSVNGVDRVRFTNPFSTTWVIFWHIMHYNCITLWTCNWFTWTALDYEGGLLWLCCWSWTYLSVPDWL